MSKPQITKSYRVAVASLGLAAALDELTRGQGILYDTAVVQACLHLYGQGVGDLASSCPPPPDHELILRQ
jgi:hypothetical protein